EVKNFLDSGQTYASNEYERLLRAIKEKRIKFIEAKKGMTFDLGSGVKLETLNPQGGGEWITKVRSGGSVENANSVVMRLSYGNFAMLLTGDAETETEQVMMNAGAPLRAQVLKVGHHGSRYATSSKFLEAVHPDVAIISVGTENRYGHPAEQTLNRLQKAGVKIYRTDLNGEIAIVTDGNKFEVHAAKQPVQVALWQEPRSAARLACMLSAIALSSKLGGRDGRRSQEGRL